jgi:hypothetical protein
MFGVGGFRPILASGIALAMLGIDLIAVMLEEPFSVLPLKQVTDGIGKSAQEHVEYAVHDEWEPKSKITSQLYKNRLAETYASHEYLEAMSTDAISRSSKLSAKSPPPPPPSPVATAGTPLPQQSQHHQYSTPPPPPPPAAKTTASSLHVEQTNQHVPSEEATPASHWNYLAEASAQMEKKFDEMDRMTQLKLDLLRGINTDVNRIYDQTYNEDNNDERP